MISDHHQTNLAWNSLNTLSLIQAKLICQSLVLSLLTLAMTPNLGEDLIRTYKPFFLTLFIMTTTISMT